MTNKVILTSGTRSVELETSDPKVTITALASLAAKRLDAMPAAPADAPGGALGFSPVLERLPDEWAA